tara:strand:- start:26 stop:502 length:477 start_codon:yes stop_codon:yes gene_type:complete
MKRDQAVRWVPIDGLPELPLGALDLSYDGSENVLTVRAYFRDLSVVGLPQFEPPAGGVIIAFDNVEGFKAYEEFADPLYADDHEVPLLAETVPYGGTWGFIQMLDSSWLERLAERNGVWSADTAGHWVVKSGEMVLHVATQPRVMPTFKGWLEKTEPT